MHGYWRFHIVGPVTALVIVYSKGLLDMHTTAQVRLTGDSVITSKWNRFTATYRRPAVSLIMQLLREHHRKLSRQQARRQYHSERRSAVIQCAGGDRLRSVGHDCVAGNACQRRSRPLSGCN